MASRARIASRGHRVSEEKTLPFVATLRRYQLQLLFRFDAFSDHGFVEAGAKTGDGADNRPDVTFVTFVTEFVDE